MKNKTDKGNKELGTKTNEASDNNPTQLSQGLAETHEQISDTYMSGNNEDTFLRDEKDLVEKDQN